jgi:hypothetical protein
MGNIPQMLDPAYAFWLTVYAISTTVLALTALGWFWNWQQRRKQLTWDMYTEYIDVSEFSNRNIPLRLTYKGTEPRWLWATYLALYNSGRKDIFAEDSPERQNIVVGKEGCRYIGFNHLVSDKARVTLSPLFKGNDVYCKIEFDRLGPGDEILCSLLFVADEKHEVQVEGELFGKTSRIVSGHRQRQASWRALWWLLIVVVILGIIGGYTFLQNALYFHQNVMMHFQALLILYLIALIWAAVFLKPIHRWQQLPQRFNMQQVSLGSRFIKTLRFIVGLDQEL